MKILKIYKKVLEKREKFNHEQNIENLIKEDFKL